jgi:hypothetical protein
MKVRLPLFIFSLASLGLALVACSGDHRSTTTTANTYSNPQVPRSASISLSIRWPEQTRLIPLAAQSIKIEIRDAQNNMIGDTPKIIARPVGNTSNIVLNDLQPGNISVKATAFPNIDATGIAQSTGIITTTIQTGQTTAALLVMDSTITSVKINGNDGTPLTIGQTRGLTAQALNSAGETVLVASSQWEWTGSNTANFTLTPSGESASLLATSVGSTTISLKDKESGKMTYTTISSRDGSLDSTKIAFSGYNNNGNWIIYIIKPNGTGQTQITNDTSSNLQPYFSSNGQKIVFESYRDNVIGTPEIYVMSSTGAQQIRLTNNNLYDTEPVFSPNDQKIAFTRYNGNDWDIYLMRADGTEQTQVTTSHRSELSPSFSPDGSKMVKSTQST